MRTKLITLLAASLPAFAQGTIQLSNANLPGPTPGTTYNAVIGIGIIYWLPPEQWGGYPGDRGEGTWLAGLFLEGSMTPLVTTTFFSGTGEDSQYNWMFATEPQVAVPGIQPGQSGRFYVGAWPAADGTFANSMTRGPGPAGFSAVFTSRPLGGPNPIPGELPFTTPVTTFQGFTVTHLSPEPGTIALFAIGVLSLLLKRRR